MNVKTRKDFNHLLKLLRSEEIKVVDTETNGLRPYHGNKLISLSIYFPSVDQSFNVAFSHGEGQVEINWTDKYTLDTPFSELTWQGKAKKQVYLSYWFRVLKEENQSKGQNYFGNLPEEWLVELKKAWGYGTYILHNSRFDAHFLAQAGFPNMDKVYDTMIALHIVNEDWRGLRITAPYTYNKTEAPSPDMVGQWARDENGELMTKEQPGNRQLKWQCAMLGFDNATAGEEDLFKAIKQLKSDIVDIIMENIDEPINESLLTAKIKKAADKATTEDWQKQREKIEAKVEIDPKANLWMLPSELVSYYAELDVILTWKLYQWAMDVIEQWDNVDLWEKQSLIHHHVAWEMERNGLRVDMKEAQKQIRILNPRIRELEDLLQKVASDWGVEDFNANSPQQLLRFLNSGVLAAGFPIEWFPEWVADEQKLGLKVYPSHTKINPGDLTEAEESLGGTDKRELEKVEDHPVVRLIRELRQMHKSVNTYLKKWVNAADENGIIRFSVNDDGTVAGRASSSGDAGNGQNIPERGGYTIKRAMTTYDNNWRLVAADYGQLELRLGAWIGEGLLGFDPKMTMTNLFLSGADMHSYVRDMINVRSILFGDMDDVAIVGKLGYRQDNEKIATEATRAEVVADYCRQVAKTMNFGLLYSGGANMLSKLLKIDKAIAQVLVEQWRALFPAFPLTQQHITDVAMERRLRPDGKAYGMYYTQPISGRHRKLHKYPKWLTYWEDGYRKGFDPQEAAARKVWNNTVQGLGGYIAMWSAYRIGEEVSRVGIKMFVNIHDALEMHVQDLAVHLVPQAAAIMVDWPQIVPGLTVDVSASTNGNWQDMRKIKDMDKWVAAGGKFL